MRLKNILPVLLLTLTCTPLLALEDGDLAPRNSLVYARIGDLSKANARLAGADWKEIVDRMLLVRSERDFEESNVAVTELRKFIDKFGRTEVAIADIMIREPFVQMAVISKLKAGAPAKFSEEFQEFLADIDRDMEVSETAFTFNDMTCELKDGHLIYSVGGMMKTHLEDVLDGFSDEALSKTKRFQDWNKNANSDVVVFADMKAWRNALDRLGEDFNDDARRAMEYVEWQKWDHISASVDLPSETGGGLAVTVDLILSQPFERLNALMKPAGGSRLAQNLPAETLGFVTAQLGNNHDRTYNDLLKFFHDIEQEERPARLKRRISWHQRDLEEFRNQLKQLEDEDKDKDKDDVAEPDGEWDEKKWLKERIAELEKNIARYEKELTNAANRPLQLNREEREGEESDAEDFHDNLAQALSNFGLTREDVLGAVGREFIMGVIGLPDPQPDDDDPSIFEDMWFVACESGEKYNDVKEKFLDSILARTMPEGITEEQKQELKERAEAMAFEKVEGGELLREKGLFSNFCAFGNDQVFGIAPNEDIAKMILASSAGKNRFDTSNLPGDASGSKYAYCNLGEFLARMMDGEYYKDVERSNFPRPFFDIREHFPSGAHVAVSTSESGTNITFSLNTRSIDNLRPVLLMAEDEILTDKKWDHDSSELYELANGVGQWYIANAEALAKADSTEKSAMLNAVNPAKLLDDGYFSPQDGLRSAFDPALQERLKAAWKQNKSEIGPADKEASPTDLSESSFEWFGLPDKEIHGHIICASKGAWARGGYLCVVSSGSRADVQWLHADYYEALKKANADGGGENEMIKPKSSKPLPAWKIKRRFRNKRWQLDSMAYDLKSRVDQAKADGKVFKGEFTGANEEDATAKLREFFGLSEEDWLQYDDAKNLTIKVNEDGTFTAKYEQDGHWLEINDKMEMTASWSK
ncbi:MAG: hypothetical protein ACYTDT_12695 [Planctomycetota bacterium]|jgi:hypothetical protein